MLSEIFYVKSSFTMYSFLQLLLFTNLIVGSFSAIFLERQREIPGHEGQCYDKEENAFYKVGEDMKWRSKGCVRKLCSTSMGKPFIEYQTCGAVSVPPGCYEKANPKLPYPDCCSVIVCKKLPPLEKTSLNI